MKRKNLFLAVIVVFSLILSLAGCKKDDVKPDEQKVENPVETYTESNLYIGVVGFNDHLNFMGTNDRHFKQISSSYEVEGFISNLSMANGTLLYYSVDSALNLLQKVQFPADLDNVSIVTFTDGLDQGSGVMNSNYTSSSEYLNAMSEKLRSTRVNGRAINAYSIGILGSDVTDKIQFTTNLNKLASSSLNVTEVSEMSAVRNRFKNLAYEIKSSLKTDITLRITTPYEGTKIRFTFDDVDNASFSSTYLEGVYRNGALTEIKCVGCSCSNGTTVTAEKNGIHSSLTFSSLKSSKGTDIESGNIQQWEYSQNISGWQINSEFEQRADVKYARTSVIMLVLDCSSSLRGNFSLMKQCVTEFLNILNGTFVSDLENDTSTVSIDVPTVTTAAASKISFTTVTLEGCVTNEHGATVTERGCCWSTKLNPTIDDNKKMNGTGTGKFTVSLSSLAEGTTYYVRAYAINSAGISYGNSVSFTTKSSVGAIKAAFSVSSSTQVYFSQGNLQYQASTGTWRFAEHQYDIIGSDNSNISSSYSGWIDLFGWGTSGYNGKNPYMTSTKYSDYGYGYNIAGTSYDWGVYNKISNGGNSAGMWRTLTQSEWSYLINSRANASSKKGVATVNDVTGLILLPDDWTLPDGLTFTSGASGDYAQNTYSASEWSKMEANGAVFLPAAGRRGGTGVGYVGSDGYYWSSSANDSYDASYLYFYGSNVYTYGNYRSYGHSVRLVRGVEE